MRPRLENKGVTGDYSLTLGGNQLNEDQTIAEAGIDANTEVVVNYANINIIYSFLGREASLSV